jgi:hypothetical protein
LAEAARAAYIKRASLGRPVTLARVQDSRTNKVHTLQCSGTSLVTCTGDGKSLVYLY